MPNLTDTLAANLRHHRTRMGLTQARLAETSGVAQNHVAEIEAGRKSPSLELVENFARALGI